MIHSLLVIALFGLSFNRRIYQFSLRPMAVARCLNFSTISPDSGEIVVKFSLNYSIYYSFVYRLHLDFSLLIGYCKGKNLDRPRPLLACLLQIIYPY